MGVETREHVHGDSEAIKARLEQERLQFQNTRTHAPTQETHSVAPVIAGEHIHHHVHEVLHSRWHVIKMFTNNFQTIQPIIQKETIQPQVIHTTVPIHEIHHNEAKHHSASALPAVSLEEFKRQGGTLTGREERFDGFEGEPRAIGSTLGSTSTSRNTGTHSSHLENKLDPRVDSDRDGSRTGYSGGTTTGKKPNLIDRLNPTKDTDGDGKKGVLE